MNAIDDQDNLVGFSTSDDCCAHGGWFVSSQIEKDSEKWSGLEMNEDKTYSDYRFDTTFFEEGKNKDSDGSAVFKLIAWNKEPLYLHLFNCHNGYYGKGFSYNFGGKLIEGGI